MKLESEKENEKTEKIEKTKELDPKYVFNCLSAEKFKLRIRKAFYESCKSQEYLIITKEKIFESINILFKDLVTSIIGNDRLKVSVNFYWIKFRPFN